MWYPSFICLLVSFTAITGTPDLYWRPFDGSIPTDAFVAFSNDIQNIYVGNVPIWGGGIYIGQLYSGVREITVTGASETSDGSVHTRTENIQILCTRNPELFEWRTVNASTLHDLPYQLVEGGFEHQELDVLYVGRVELSTGWEIGKVCGYHYTDADRIFFLDGDHEGNSGTYDVLVYKGLKNENKSF